MKNKLLKLINNHKIVTIIGITILFLFAVPPIIHFIVTTDWGIGFIAPDNQDTWINFYGAIIGGGITLGGVAWTIYDQNKKREDDLIRQYKPLIDVSVRCKQEDKTSFEYVLTEEVSPDKHIYQRQYFDSHSLSISLSIKNIGNSIIKDGSIKCCYKSTYFTVRHLQSLTNPISHNKFFKDEFIIDIKKFDEMSTFLNIEDIIIDINLINEVDKIVKYQLPISFECLPGTKNGLPYSIIEAHVSKLKTTN